MRLAWFVGAALALGLATTEVRADHGDGYGIGYDRGLREGAKHGAKDARNGEDFNFAHDGKYWKADRGYRWEYGSRHRYASGYRAGYQAGYRSGYYGQHRGRHGYGYRYDDRSSRHRHSGRDGWCNERHDDWNRNDWDDEDRIIYEQPRW